MTKVLPDNWAIVPLRELLETLESGSRPKGGVKGIESGVPSLGGEHLDSNGGFKFEKIRFVPEAFAAKMTRGRIQHGDILVVKDGATTGKTSFIGASFPYPEAVINEHVFICRCRVDIDPKYVFYFLYSADGNRQILEDFRGAAQGGISQRFAEIVKVPLAPLDQQKRIVAEIEKQFSRLDEAVTNLKRVKANLKRYKAAILKAAVEGRLVETEAERARREGRSYETGAQLLQRILEPRRSQWKGKGKYKEPAAPDTTDLPELPEGWVWATTSQVLREVKDGTHETPKYHEIGVPFITQKHVKAAGFVFEDFSRISRDDHEHFFKRSNPERGDILVSMIGVNRGESCIVDTEEVFSIKNVGLFKPDHRASNVKFIQYYLSSTLGQRLLLRGSKGGAQPFVGLTELRNWSLPLPPYEEQHRIVAEVDRRLSLVDEADVQVNANLRRAERLRQSVLASAFSKLPSRSAMGLQV